MKKQILPNLIYCVLLLSFFGIVFCSCQKIPGHAVTPGGGSTGTGSGSTTGGSTGGATFGTATGTITFTIGTGATNTWTQPVYFVGLGTTPTTGALALSNSPSTIVTAGPNDLSLFTSTSFSVSFPGITPGTYPMNPAGSFVWLPSMQLTGAGGSEKVTVSSENITITSTSLGTAKGSVKGSFDGKMLNTATYDSIRVAGTFDVQLQ